VRLSALLWRRTYLPISLRTSSTFGISVPPYLQYHLRTSSTSGTSVPAVSPRYLRYLRTSGTSGTSVPPVSPRYLRYLRTSGTKDTVVPARAQVDVSTKLVYDSLDFVPRKQQEVWGTESTRVKDGLLVARTIVPDKVDDVPVTVLNTTSAPVVVSKGTLQPLVLMEEATTAPPADGRKTDPEIITDTVYVGTHRRFCFYTPS